MFSEWTVGGKSRLQGENFVSAAAFTFWLQEFHVNIIAHKGKLRNTIIRENDNGRGIFNELI